MAGGIRGSVLVRLNSDYQAMIAVDFLYSSHFDCYGIVSTTHFVTTYENK